MSVKNAVLFALTAVVLTAQTTNREMSADRPGFRNSTHLVGRGVIQIENGFRVFSEDVPGARPGLALDPAIRFGAAPWLELRLYADTVVLRSPQGAGESGRIVGVSDFQPGIKVPLVGQSGGPLRVVAVLKTSVPNGHPAQSSGGYEPGSELIFERELPRDFSIAGTWNVTRLKDDGFVWQQAGSLQLNRKFRRAWNASMEVYGSSPEEREGSTQWFADMAVSRRVGHNLMLDAWVARTLHGRRSWFAAVGLARRSHVPATR